MNWLAGLDKEWILILLLMKRNTPARNQTVCLTATVVAMSLPVALLGLPVSIDLPSSKKLEHAETFKSALQRAGSAASSGDWERDGWADEDLESSVSRLVTRVQEITGYKHLEVPVTFREVRPAALKPVIFKNRNIIAAGRRVRLRSASSSIILAEEIAEIRHARNCLIISRGAVDVSHGEGNVVIAGHSIHIFSDGDPRTAHAEAKKKPADRNFAVLTGSVLIAGSVVDVEHANGSIVCAPLAARMDDATLTTFINCPNRYLGPRTESDTHTDRSGLLPGSAPSRRLEKELQVLKIIDPPRRLGERGLLKTRDGRWFERGGEIKGWNILFVKEHFALFRRDGELAGAFVPPRRRR